ncbi:MAG: hypothetical protein HOI95_12475 [Chromatiales bacterium]|jgi:hypothetical protein|nr:hypothetical protein [Chromatiales bacterium]
MRTRRSGFFAVASLGVLLCLTALQPGQAATDDPLRFKRVATQYIAALGNPKANSGTGAQDWGLWPLDPGPRGVALRHYDRLQSNGGVAPAQWRLNDDNWWLEENGLIMEEPVFPLPAGKYLVTGMQGVVTVLTVHTIDADGASRWELGNGASLYDVTHLRCRSAVYTPAAGPGSCSPANAPLDAFRVAPGAEMPPVDGCLKQDYAVLFLIGVPVNQ